MPTPTPRVESWNPDRIALEVDGDEGTATVVIDGAFAVRSVEIDR
ncbi:hypothetical protein [Haloterrigena turkmenica]|nr:hypothetical protein [Haloterrigena turkmenica]